MSEFAENVGTWDAIVRFVAGASILATGFVVAAGLPPEWFLTVILHPAILGAYLLMTAVARNDVFYHVFRFSTRRARRERPKGRERREPRVRGRPLG